MNCAEMGGDKAFADLTVREWAWMIGVHLRDTFLVTHAFFADMAARGCGRIILISSQLGYKGAADLAQYCAAKAGIVGFTWALSYEGAPQNVMVNATARCCSPLKSAAATVVVKTCRRMAVVSVMPMLRRIQRQEKAQFATLVGEPSAIPPTTDLVAAAPGRKNKIRPSLLVDLLSFDHLPPFAC